MHGKLRKRRWRIAVGSCEEYIGMDLIKYYKENQERIEKSQMMNQTMGRDSAKKQAFDMAVQQILGKLGK